MAVDESSRTAEGGEGMFGRRKTRAERMRHDAREMAMRGLERGRHRAEALRESLPEAAELISDLRDQAEPVLKAAREQAAGTPLAQKKKSRSKKPLIFIALAVAGAVVAYLIWSKRDHEPAYLMEEPDVPDTSPADAPSGSGNGSTPDADPSPGVNGVPERASAYMAGEPARPTQAGSASPSVPSTPTSSQESTSQPSTFGYQPRAQVAAWDLPPSSIPPMRSTSTFGRALDGGA